MQTHHPHEEGCSPFYAFEPRTFTLPLDAYQLHKDIVGGGGLSETRRRHLQFVLDHRWGLERKALWIKQELASLQQANTFEHVRTEPHALFTLLTW